MSRGKTWTASDTAEMAVLVGKHWPNWRIARKLGFSRRVVQERRDAMGLPSFYRARREMPLTFRVAISPTA